MLDQVLEIFKIKPDYDLNIMKPNQSLSQITSRVMLKLDDILETEKPDIVLVHGDTTTTFAASISAFTIKQRWDMWRQDYEPGISIHLILKK